jgi:branched-chain amino acid transport system permease protein
MRVATLTTIAGVLFYSIAALGLNLLLGYSGLVSLGTAGFMGMGAYVAAYFSMDMGFSFWVALLLAIVITAAWAL